tara:strand:- start:413 stop:817 length:405 start_codon:yes stop_codon:yes gene_type:complete
MRLIYTINLTLSLILLAGCFTGAGNLNPDAKWLSSYKSLQVGFSRNQVFEITGPPNSRKSQKYSDWEGEMWSLISTSLSPNFRTATLSLGFDYKDRLEWAYLTYFDSEQTLSKTILGRSPKSLSQNESSSRVLK